jgi:signal transduction histidine kinase
MPLRTKLLLSLMSLALLPLILFGITAYITSTNSLRTIEQDGLTNAVDRVESALTSLQDELVRTSIDYGSWDEMHDRVATDQFDQEWLETNYGPEGAASVATTHNLTLLGIWIGNLEKQVYTVGDLDSAMPFLTPYIKDAVNGEPTSRLLSLSDGVYIVAWAPTKTSGGEDPNGVLLLARRLGEDDVANIKQLAGYDVGLYKGQQLIATTQSTTTPAPNFLVQADAGQGSYDVSSADLAVAFEPIKDASDKTLMTIVVWRPRTAITAAQDSIAQTLALWFVLSAVIAAIVVILLQNSISQPLLAMANTAKAIASGDLSKRMVAPSRRDELGQLAAAFNQMADKTGERVIISETENVRLHAMDDFRLGLLRSIAQGIQNPMSQIQQHSATLHQERYGSLNETQKESVAVIRRAVNIQSAMVSDLIDFAQAQQKQLRIAAERLTLGEILDEAMPIIRQTYAAKRIRFVPSIPMDLPMIFADRTRMVQILDKLLNWAFNNTSAEGQVRLMAAKQHDTVLITVADTSSGLTAAEQAKIFDLFYHTNGNGHNSYREFDLGLAFVKALIEQQGGRIDLSAEPGKGNTFSFTVPLTT